MLNFLTPNELSRVPNRKSEVLYAWIPNWPEYFCGDDGTIFSTKCRRHPDWHQLHPCPAKSRGGYLVVSLSNDEGHLTKRLHRIILGAFEPAPSPRHHAAHRDGVRTNNVLSNLLWSLPSENIAHKIVHGTRRFGHDHYNCNHSPELVLRIKQLRLEGLSYPKIATTLECNMSFAWKVCTGGFPKKAPLSVAQVKDMLRPKSTLPNTSPSLAAS